MGGGDKASLQLQFNPKVRLEFHGSTITSDAGLLPLRELDEALGLTGMADYYLHDRRTGRNIQHQLVPLLRQSVFSRVAGYDDTNDAERLAQDPAMRIVLGWRGSERNAASASEMGRFETELLTQEDNLGGLALMNGQWVERAMAQTPHRRVILDLDSSESPVHGQQEGAAYNGHFKCVCFHPLFCFNQFGDCEGAVLRPGNVHSADGWQEFIEPIIERYLKEAVRLLFRGDAAFAKPEITGTWRREASAMPSGCGPTKCYSGPSLTCWYAQPNGLPRAPWFTTMTSSTRPRAGTSLVEWSPRWNGTVESCFPGWGSSSPT